MITVQKWLNSLSGSNLKKRVTYLNGWLRWLKANGGQFSGFDPDGLVEYQKNADNGHKYDLLDLLQSYVTQIKGRKSYKRYVYTLIRSFFLHNRAELPQDRAFRIHADAPKTRTLLTLEDFRKLVLSLDPCNAALYLCMFMSGLGTGEIVYWSNHGAEDLREQLSNDPKIIRIDIPGRKGDRNERNFYSFIAGDALDLLRKWWKIRPRDAKVIFVNGRDTPVTESGVYAIWLRHMRRLGIIDPKKEGQREYSNRTGRGLHELRDLFRTQFTKSQAKREIAEFMMGHIVDPLGYNQVGKDERFCQDEYKKALPYLNILSSGTPFYQVPKEQVDTLVEKNEQLEKEIERNQMDIQRVMGLLMRVTERLVPAANGAAQLIKKGDKAAEQALNNGLDDVADGDKEIRKALEDLKNDFLSRSTFRKKDIEGIVRQKA